MKRRPFSLGLLSALLFAALARPQQQPVFHTEVNLINVTALVRSDEGELITDLKPEDFEVLEDGIPQHVQFFAREKEIPLNLALVLDVSGSQDKFISQHNRDVERFLSAVLSPADRAVVVCFGNHLRLVSDSTASTAQIMESLRKFSKGSRDFPEIGPDEDRDLGTALYDAVYFTIKDKLQQAEERRKVIVLFSDGEENSSEHDLLDTIEEAQRENTIIYSIRYTNTGRHHGHGHHDAEDDLSEGNSKLNARNKYGIRVMRHLAAKLAVRISMAWSATWMTFSRKSATNCTPFIPLATFPLIRSTMAPFANSPSAANGQTPWCGRKAAITRGRVCDSKSRWQNLDSEFFTATLAACWAPTVGIAKSATMLV